MKIRSYVERDYRNEVRERLETHTHIYTYIYISFISFYLHSLFAFIIWKPHHSSYLLVEVIVAEH